MEMDIINSNAAGIDIGSKSHYVAIGQALEDVKEFGIYAEELTDISEGTNIESNHLNYSFVAPIFITKLYP